MFMSARNRRFGILFLAACLLVILLSLSAVSLRTVMGDILERTDYKVYPTAQDPRDFYGRVYNKIRVSAYKQARPENIEEASQLAGFQVRAPSKLPGGWEPNQTTQTILTGAHSYQVEINLTEARRILGGRGRSYSSLPGDLDSVTVAVDILPSIVIPNSRGDIGFTIIQGRPPQAAGTPGIEPQLLDQVGELGLQYLGLSPDEAAQAIARMGWTWFLLIPPADMNAAEPVSINGQPGIFTYTTGTDIDHKALLWAHQGVLYGLYGNLTKEELVEVAASLQ